MCMFHISKVISIMDIRNLRSLLEPHFNSKIVSYDCKNLLPVGENYGSVMLALTIKIESRSKGQEVIQCVAKTVPPSEAIWKFFNVSITFKKEIAFYNKVVPLLNNFAIEKGVKDFMRSFATCLGARISMDPTSDIVDNDAVFVLENLKVHGYNVEDRLTGFDLETTKLILSNLADLHAGPIALKLKQSAVFEAELKPHLQKGMLFEAPDKMLDNLVNTIEKFASRNRECIPLLSRIGNGVRKMKSIFTYDKIREPFATITHIDLWTNNIMVKYENGKPISVKFIDFTVYEYNSPARDVLFFLYSSVMMKVIETENKIDELIKFYYDRLIETLKKLKCNIDLLTFDVFMEDVEEVARDTEFAHIMYMLTPIYTSKGEAKELSEWTPFDIATPKEECLHENYEKKLHFTVLDFAKRNWI